MQISSIATELAGDAAIRDICQQLEQQPAASLLLVAFNIEIDAAALQQALIQQQSCPILAGSSCLGGMAIAAQHCLSHASISVLAIHDPQGRYGVGSDSSTKGAQQAAEAALEQALDNSGSNAESPALLWCMLHPGEEEAALQGFADVVGPQVPVIGGSSADNDVSGQWLQFTRDQLGHDLFACAVISPSTPLGISFSSGYEPSGETLTATHCEQRLIHQLDQQSAALRYNQLTAGAIEDALKGGNVLAKTTLHPLGRRIPNPSGVDDYLLSHPDAVTEDGGLSLFSVVDSGEQLHLMRGSSRSLIQRAARVLENAQQLLPEGYRPAGAIMVYCAGCMLTINDDIEQMVNHTAVAAQGTPLCGFYTFGEQGCFLDGTNRHGNLMISAVVFSQ